MLKAFSRSLFVLCFLLAAPAMLRAEEPRPDWPFPEGDFAPLFPFIVEKGAQDNITDIQTWDGAWCDAGEGPVLSVRDGRFMKGDEPYRFMGTNLCGAAVFCDHAKAERLADTLARFGIRVVRLHHMDARWIWGKNFDRTKTEIDPDQLERLDYLIARFEKRGISVNINLHVSRGLDERDGFENSSTLSSLGKGINTFEPRMIELQKKYARDLLTHVNPYTGRAYADDPGVAMIEINNENSTLPGWYWGHVKKLGSPYRELFRAKWNEWLRSRYADTREVLEALEWVGAPAPGETLENGTLPVPFSREEALVQSAAFQKEFFTFMIRLESDYWTGMYRFLKDGLGVRPPVSGTQLLFGAWYAQAEADYCDIHRYWQHPEFPKGSWDARDWYVESGAMVNSTDGGKVGQIAVNRVLGKALTVSEYDHPYPNLYGAEGLLTLAAAAAYQGWTGINHFAWACLEDEFEMREQTRFFDMAGNQAKMVHLPACYAILQRGDVKSGPGKYVYVQDLSRAGELGLASDIRDNPTPIQNRLAHTPSLSLVCWSGLRLVDGGWNVELPKGCVNVASWDELPRERFGRPGEGEIRNEFGELRWNWEEPDGGYFTVDTRGVKVFTGFVRGRSFEFKGLTLTPGATRLDWTTVSLTAVRPPSEETCSEDGILAPGRYLLAATGLVRNTDAVFKEYGEGKITAAEEYGGTMGTAPALCEGIPLTLELNSLSPEKVSVYPLDEAGDRREAISAEKTETGCRVSVGPRYKTLWYELVVE
ncbi:MAG: hypothetical protein IKE69_07490 [Thermoguttaceae bacterium]|nr:hypothetical protein [Thermoguttaceae bacterium]